MVSRLWPPRLAGGAERYAAGLAEQLEHRGHEVRVVTYGVETEGVIATVSTHGAVPDRHWESTTLARRRSHVLDLWNPEASRVLRGAVRDFRPDVVHSHAVAGLSVAALLTDAARVHTAHDEWLLCWKGSRLSNDEPCRGTCLTCRPFAVSRRLAVRRRPPLFIAASEFMLDAHAAAGWDASRWRVVPLPVDPPAVDPAPRPPPRPGRPLRLGFLGQLTWLKGFDVLLTAVDRLGDEVRLVCGGEGALREEATRYEHVELRGRVADQAKEDLFRDIDVLVVPSRAEGAGIVVMEAAVRGVPVIASTAGGLPEYVPTSCHDLMFEPNDADALATAVQRYLAEPERFRVSGYSSPWSLNVERVLQTYADAQEERS